MDKLAVIKNNLTAAVALKNSILEDQVMLQTVVQITEVVVKQFKENKKLLFCGNGGSAADAQHLAAEFSGRYYLDRPPLFAEALHVNSSYVTAVANDYSYDHIYARLVQGMGQKGDTLIGMSTSGNSPNVVKAMKVAQEIGMHTIGFTGAQGGGMQAHCDIMLQIPSEDTPRIQECHMLLGHTICELVEAELFA